MPIYEFHCEDCGQKVEIIASISEKEKGLELVCPSCGSKRLKEEIATHYYIGSTKGASSCSSKKGFR
ncbi:MAG: zinc ribbon domain-containing protein [Candidatus Aenigmatarchaeota archaeon]